MAGAPLVYEQDLADYLQTTVTPASARIAIRGAEALLRGATKLEVWPDPVPEQLWWWALELAGLAYENPLGKTTLTTGVETDVYPATRRAEILAEAAAQYGRGAALSPLHSFPDAPPWPRG